MASSSIDALKERLAKVERRGVQIDLMLAEQQDEIVWAKKRDDDVVATQQQSAKRVDSSSKPHVSLEEFDAEQKRVLRNELLAQRRQLLFLASQRH
jgi:hypothetical protein